MRGLPRHQRAEITTHDHDCAISRWGRATKQQYGSTPPSCTCSAVARAGMVSVLLPASTGNTPAFDSFKRYMLSLR